MRTETPDPAVVIDALIRSRKTIRAFRSDPVPRAHLVEILKVARMAPSRREEIPSAVATEFRDVLALSYHRRTDQKGPRMRT